MYLDYVNAQDYIKSAIKGFPPLVITAAITGGVAGKEVNPNLPETPEEQAESAYEAYKAGASIIHIHVRDSSTGYAGMSTKTEDYYKVNKLIREKCPDVIIGNTTGVSPEKPRSEAINAVYANPEICSLNCGPLMTKGVLKKRKAPLSGRDKDVDLSDLVMPVTFNETEYFASEMIKHGVKPELEVYSNQNFNTVYNLIRKDLLTPPFSFSLIFSDAIGAAPTISNFLAALISLPPNSIFQGIGVGPAQLPVIFMSIMSGGNVRVGFEDNIFYEKGELLKSNAQMVEKVVRIAEEFGRDVATPEQTRKLLGLSNKPSEYK